MLKKYINNTDLYTIFGLQRLSHAFLYLRSLNTSQLSF